MRSLRDCKLRRQCDCKIWKFARFLQIVTICNESHGPDPFHPAGSSPGRGVRAGGVRRQRGQSGDLPVGLVSAADQPLVAARPVRPAAASLGSAADLRLAGSAAGGRPARPRLLGPAHVAGIAGRDRFRLAVLVGGRGRRACCRPGFHARCRRTVLPRSAPSSSPRTPC